jgi:aromatic ring-opening dioxygenase LigB subunit
VLEQTDLQASVLSYEAPSYFGMIVAAFDQAARP